jgi:type II secretory pathway pseudopilin PulG
MQVHFNKKVRGKAREAAFSLLEVLIAGVVIAIIYAALFSGINSTFGLLQSSRENLRATQIMVSRLEGLRLCAWDSTQLFNTNVVPPTFTDSFYPLGLQGTSNKSIIYYGTMTITANPNISPAPSYGSNIALVTVTVTWTNGANAKPTLHQRSMSTFAAKYGLQNYVYYH